MKTKINKRQLGAVLRESIFAPNKPGPMKIIIDVGDPRYYVQRAIELSTLSLTALTAKQQEYYLEQAITLLAVAKHIIRTNFEEVVHRATEEHEIRGKYTAVDDDIEKAKEKRALKKWEPANKYPKQSR